MSYIVVIEDYYKNLIEVEVSKEVYEVFQEDKRGEKAQSQAEYRHGCSMKVEHDITSYIARQHHPSLEEEYLLREHLREVLEVINSCSKIQKQRFYLNRIFGYTFVEIARKEQRNESSVFRSIKWVEKKLFLFSK